MCFERRCQTPWARALAAPRGRLQEPAIRGLIQFVAQNTFPPPVLDEQPLQRTRGNRPFKRRRSTVSADPGCAKIRGA